MIGALLRWPGYALNRALDWPRVMPLNLTLSPSTRCNSRCQTCNIWKKRQDELTLDEWRRVLESIGKTPIWFTLSGGEPFLYRDIAELAVLVYDHCRPSVINIPTNGWLVERIADAVQRIAEYCRKTQIVINLSLDGVGEQHDRIRGVPGSFAHAEATWDALKSLTPLYPNLSLGIHTVISTHNVESVLPVYDYAFSRRPDSYITEIAEERVELDTLGSGITPTLEQYRRAIEPLIERMSQREFSRIGRLTQAFRIEYYRMVQQVLARPVQPIPCYAGRASAHIYCDGSVWACCVRADPMGNVRQSGFDFRPIWYSAQADSIRHSIARQECACPLANAAYTNMLMNAPTLARVTGRLLRQVFRPSASHQPPVAKVP